ncbi:MAG: CorA family divalent cation transporter [Sphingopyxis sp.]
MISALCLRDGVVTALDRAQIAPAIARRTADQCVWVHVQHWHQTGGDLGALHLSLPPTVQRALLAVETRPRCEPMDNGVLINLRVEGADDAAANGDALVSVRLWAEQGFILSVSLRPSAIVPKVEADFRAGHLRDPGDVIIALVASAAEEIDPIVAQLGDDLDELECDLGPNTPFAARRRVTQLRTRAISYRRFVNPQRMALERLAQLPLGWMDDGERAAVREAADRFARMAEELESVRERAAVLHEELTDLRAERIDARSLQIAIVAMIFLPLTFLTGLLGMNVRGIPFADAPWAFWGVTALCLLIAIVVGGYFIIRRWSSG